MLRNFFKWGASGIGEQPKTLPPLDCELVGSVFTEEVGGRREASLRGATTINGVAFSYARLG